MSQGNTFIYKSLSFFVPSDDQYSLRRLLRTLNWVQRLTLGEKKTFENYRSVVLIFLHVFVSRTGLFRILSHLLWLCIGCQYHVTMISSTNNNIFAYVPCVESEPYSSFRKVSFTGNFINTSCIFVFVSDPYIQSLYETLLCISS